MNRSYNKKYSPGSFSQGLLIIKFSLQSETLGMTLILKCLTKTMYSTKLTFKKPVNVNTNTPVITLNITEIWTLIELLD